LYIVRIISGIVILVSCTRATVLVLVRQLLPEAQSTVTDIHTMLAHSFAATWGSHDIAAAHRQQQQQQQQQLYWRNCHWH